MRTKTSTVVREQPTFIEAARRTQIVAAATETIAELGYINASLAQIAKRAGVSKSVIGYYYATKDELVRAVVDTFYVTGHVEMMRRLEGAPGATELLQRYITSNLAYIAEHRSETRAIGDIVANFRGADGLPVYQIDDAEPLIQGTAAIFDWGQQAGEFRQFDSRIVAVILRSAIDAFGQQLSANPELDIEKYTREMTDFFLQAARKTT